MVLVKGVSAENCNYIYKYIIYNIYTYVCIFSHIFDQSCQVFVIAFIFFPAREKRFLGQFL